VVRAPAARQALAGAAVVVGPRRLAEQRQATAGPPEAVAARRAAAAQRRQTLARPTRRAPLAALEQSRAAQGQPAAAQAGQPRPERQAPPRARPTWRAQAARPAATLSLVVLARRSAQQRSIPVSPRSADLPPCSSSQHAVAGAPLDSKDGHPGRRQMTACQHLASWRGAHALPARDSVESQRRRPRTRSRYKNRLMKSRYSIKAPCNATLLC